MLTYLSSGGTFPPLSQKLLALSCDEFLCTLHWMTAKAQKRLEIEAESHYEFHKAWIDSTFFCKSMAMTRYLVTAQCWKEILLGSRFDLICGCGCWWTCQLKKIWHCSVVVIFFCFLIPYWYFLRPCMVQLESVGFASVWNFTASAKPLSETQS